jgi:hypothetical protein
MLTLDQLLASRKALAERRSRGRCEGNHGLRRLTKTEKSSRDGRWRGYDGELEMEIAEIVAQVAYRVKDERETLNLYLLENGEPNWRLEIPF